eukprot:scaffold1166_cov261-Pinguiococcus_pyrenoidosus.AAC.29
MSTKALSCSVCAAASCYSQCTGRGGPDVRRTKPPWERELPQSDLDSAESRPGAAADVPIEPYCGDAQDHQATRHPGGARSRDARAAVQSTADHAAGGEQLQRRQVRTFGTFEGISLDLQGLLGSLSSVPSARSARSLSSQEDKSSRIDRNVALAMDIRTKGSEADTKMVKIYSEIEVTKMTLHYVRNNERVFVLEQSFYRENAKNVRGLFRNCFIGIALYQVTVGLTYDLLSYRGSSLIQDEVSTEVFVIMLALRVVLGIGCLKFVRRFVDTTAYYENQSMPVVAWCTIGTFALIQQVMQRAPSEGLSLLVLTCLFNMTPTPAPVLSILGLLYSVGFAVIVYTTKIATAHAQVPCEPSVENDVSLKTKTVGSCVALVSLFASVSFMRQDNLMHNHLLVQRLQVQKRLLHTQRALTEGILNSLWPPAVMQEMKNKDTPEVVATYSDVTVIFCIIDKFDEIGNVLNANEIVALLDIVFSKFDELCDKHQVYKIETVGQVYLAVSGCPERSLRNHGHAADMALNMTKLVPGLRKELTEELTKDSQEQDARNELNVRRQMFSNFNIKVGLQCGSVVGGVVGRASPRFKLIGDTVNTASRMESTAPPGEIQVTSNFYRKVEGDNFLFEQREPFFVKGKGIMTTYLLKGHSKERTSKNRRQSHQVGQKDKNKDLYKSLALLRFPPAGPAMPLSVVKGPQITASLSSKLQEHALNERNTVFSHLKWRADLSISLELVVLYMMGDAVDLGLSDEDARAEVAYRVRIFQTEVGRLRAYSIVLLLGVPAYVGFFGSTTSFRYSTVFLAAQCTCFACGAFMLQQTFNPRFVYYHSKATLFAATLLLAVVTYINAESGESSGYGFNALLTMMMYLESNIPLVYRFILAICMALWYYFILTVSNTNSGLQSLDYDSVCSPDTYDQPPWGSLCESLYDNNGAYSAVNSADVDCSAEGLSSCLGTASFFLSQMLLDSSWRSFEAPRFNTSACPFYDDFLNGTADYTVCSAWDQSVKRYLGEPSEDESDRYRRVTKADATFGLVWLLLFSIFLVFPVFIANYHVKLAIVKSNSLRVQDQLIKEETRKYKEWLDKLLPPSVVNEMVSKKSIVDDFPSVTVLFADLVGFTKFSASVTATELVVFLNNLYDAFDVVLSEYGMYRVEIIGDALFAVAGCPLEYVDHLHPLRAALTAQGLLYELDKINQMEEEANSQRRFNLRVGIHTGPVVGAVVGKKDPRYHVFGATVTKAELMEQNSMPGRIHCSKETFEAMHGLMHGAYEGMLSCEERQVLKSGESSYFVNVNRVPPLPPLGVDEVATSPEGFADGGDPELRSSSRPGE